MNYTLIFNKEAEEEYRSSYLWYEEQQQGLGKRFGDEIVKQLQQILTNPKTFHYSKGKFRECVVTGFPYVIVYFENKLKRTVNISSIHHTSRNPKLKYRKPK